MSAISFRMIGTGRAVPNCLLTNERLTQMIDTSDEWITSRTGIRARHICTTETLTDLAVQAAAQALAQAQVSAAELDLILCATMQGDYVMPALACMVQNRIGAVCPAFDINAACTGFVYALDVAAGFFARGRVKNVLLIAAECLSKHVDWNDRTTCVLFGDGAGAVVLAEGDSLLASTLSATGNDQALAIYGTHSTFPGVRPIAKKQAIEMNGQEVYRFAVNAICRDIEMVMREANVSTAEVRYFMLHQANQRILDAARSRLNVDEDKVVSSISRFGNTSAASIPIMLDEINRAGQLQLGDIIIFCAFGGGLTTGAAAMRW